MKTLLILTLSAVICVPAFTQLAVNGTSTANSVPNKGPAIVVDNAITVTGTTIPAFSVYVSGNFSSGDILSYTGSLPPGVTSSYSSGTGILTFTGSATAASYQALLRTVTFSTTSSSALVRTVTFRAGDNTLSYNTDNGHFYRYVSGSYSWTGAKANAAAQTFFGMTGYLVTVTNSTENTFVTNLSGKGWIGASDSYTEINAATGVTTYPAQSNAEGKWYWVTGPEKGTQFSNGSSVFTYANWSSGEPNNSSTVEHYAENSWAGGGKWNDSQVGGPLGYILEFGGLSGEPAVDIFHSRTITMIATEIKSYGSGSPYVLSQPSVYVDPSLTVYSSGNITDARVTISGNFQSGDVLSYAGGLPSGVTVSGGGYNASTGVLSFTGTTTPSNWQSLLRTVKFSSTSGTVGNRDITFSVGNQVAYTNGHFYESVNSGANWSTAKSNAAARTYLGLQGYLATITSAEENAFIKQKLGTDAWIGLSDEYNQINTATGTNTYGSQSAAEGKWYWVTGPEKGTQITTTNASGSGTGTQYGTAYNNWNNGEPNNVGSEHYGEIYASGSAPGKWNDLNGAGSLSYVVEYGGLSTDPALTLSANATIINGTILPVTGLQLNVRQKGKNIEVAWSTETETNCDHFDVLYSTDDVTFAKIATVSGHGNTNIRQYYAFTHTSPVFGNNFYKLQQFDNDGRFKYSSVKQAGYGLSAAAYLYPNPAHDQLTVVHSSKNSGGTVLIYDMNGKVMKKEKIVPERNTLNIGALAPGMYIAEISDGAKSTQLIFVKQ